MYRSEETLNPGDTRSRTIDRIAVIAIIIAAILSFIAFGLPYLQSHFGSGLPHSLSVAVGSRPESVLYATTKEHTLIPITVSVKGTSLPAVDAIKGKDGLWYYLLLESPNDSVTNLYSVSSKGVATRLTTSDTAKYDLSYDSETNTFAYQALPQKGDSLFSVTTGWNITIFNPITSSESMVGTGERPRIVTGGMQVFYAEGGYVNVLQVPSHATSSIMTLATSGGLYAVNAKGTELSLYNSTTHSIDHYALMHGASPSYVSSETLSITPVAMDYVSGELLVAYAAKTGSSTTFSFATPRSTSKSILIQTAVQGIPQRIYDYK